MPCDLFGYSPLWKKKPSCLASTGYVLEQAGRPSPGLPWLGFDFNAQRKQLNRGVIYGTKRAEFLSGLHRCPFKVESTAKWVSQRFYRTFEQRGDSPCTMDAGFVPQRTLLFLKKVHFVGKGHPGFHLNQRTDSKGSAPLDIKPVWLSLATRQIMGHLVAGNHLYGANCSRGSLYFDTLLSTFTLCGKRVCPLSTYPLHSEGVVDFILKLYGYVLSIPYAGFCPHTGSSAILSRRLNVKRKLSSVWQPQGGISATNPPAPVERVDCSPQLGLPSESLTKAEGSRDF